MPCLQKILYCPLSSKLPLNIKLVKNSYIIVSSFHPEDNTTEVKIVTGIKKRAKKILKILGRDPVGMRLKLDTQSAKERIMKGRLVEVKGGLHELSFNKIPKKNFNLSRKTESLGLQLVNSLISQLNGTIKIQQKTGTKYTLVF